jgi:hypothetical protein
MPSISTNCPWIWTIRAVIDAPAPYLSYPYSARVLLSFPRTYETFYCHPFPLSTHLTKLPTTSAIPARSSVSQHSRTRKIFGHHINTQSHVSSPPSPRYKVVSDATPHPHAFSSFTPISRPFVFASPPTCSPTPYLRNEHTPVSIGVVLRPWYLLDLRGPQAPCPVPTAAQAQIPPLCGFWAWRILNLLSMGPAYRRPSPDPTSVWFLSLAHS